MVFGVELCVGGMDLGFLLAAFVVFGDALAVWLEKDIFKG
jgi:hypothetical protein